MKILKKALLIFCSAFSALYSSSAQNLPSQYHISGDGLRLIRGNTDSYGLYSGNKIDTIYLTFSQSDFWTKLTNNYGSKTDLPATLTYKSNSYDSVGVRFKGETSYRMVSGQKKSFNITLNYKKDQDIEGYKTLNLNNAAEDPSFMREFLFEYFNNKHIPSAKVNYVILMINGTSWGLYVNVQQLNKKHASEWFIDADATRWRAEPVNRTGFGGGFPGGGGFPDSVPVGGGFPNDTSNMEPPGGGFGMSGFGAGSSSLNYLYTMEDTVYQKYYTLKDAYKENPWDDLIKACYYLKNTPEEQFFDTLNKYLNVDEALWFLAHEILFTDDDSYINKGGTDYYVYFDVATNKIIPIEFDGNSSFSTQNASSWGPFHKENDTIFPLANVLFKVPELRQRYLAHVRTILNESFNSNYSDSIIDHYASFIDPYVKNDTKKIYTYDKFKTEINTLKSFIKTRRNFYISNKEVNVTGPVIGKVAYKTGEDLYSAPSDTQEVIITAVVEDRVKAVNLYYGTDLAGTFNKLVMYDDGLHNDGYPGDGIFGEKIPSFPRSTYVRFYIEAVAPDTTSTRTYSPAGAEHDVYMYRVKVAEWLPGNVVINEIMPSNSVTAADQNGEYNDWIELHNKSESVIDLSGYYLTDNDGKLTKWEIPEGTTIEGKGYRIFWADDDTTQNGLHTNFKLSAGGESVLLITPDLQIADQVTFNGQSAEVSFSRIPNGTGSFSWQQATFNSENIVISSLKKLEISNSLRIYPNPANENVNIISDNEIEPSDLYICDIYGKLIYFSKFSKHIFVNVSEWNSGVYFIKSGNGSTGRVVVIH